MGVRDWYTEHGASLLIGGFPTGPCSHVSDKLEQKQKIVSCTVIKRVFLQ